MAIVLLVVYIIIGLFFAAIQDYDSDDLLARNLLKGLFVGVFWPIIWLVFLLGDI